MVHEYALEPELVATWGNRHDFRYFIEKFGLGHPRIVSRYPRRWQRLVWEAFRSNDEFEKARMTELVVRLSERMVHRRDYVWEPERAWIENAHREHARFPFHAVLARENSTNHPSTLVAEELGEATPLWAVPSGRTITRSATEMATTVAAMLRIADVVIFVDPYFGPGRPEHRRPLEAFLRAAVNGRPILSPSRVEIHTSLDREKAPEAEFFQRECHQRLPRCIPEGVCLVLLRLGQRFGGQRPHNRYILTDVGGLVFGAGLDEGAEGTTDDVTLMDRQQYELRWSQHVADVTTYFEVEDTRLEIRSRR